MSEILESLFGSKERARLLRFFLQNPDQEYAYAEIVRRNMFRGSVKSEVEKLRKIKFILRHSKRGQISYMLNQSFSFYSELKNLISKSNIYPQCKSLANISKVGNIKLAAISGVFINYNKSKADMIIVGDDIRRAKLKNLMSSLEAEIGREIDFVLMSGEEFKYRLNMVDKFILDFLEGPHEELINKITGLKHLIIKRNK
ncbi:MAG: hypothetical protein COX30_02280 [Candidatus Moranbacteria bacterium CG23_combo_of_CG06-09_8_20_14_all_39_10]|nr:MAG: hypothetical protein COX30_02280 [Candidatus Moranbacteria bacterium CG23_combo_of_CG06-09_8_20_14_all_39_10]